MYTKQENQDISVYLTMHSEDTDKRIWTGTKEATLEFILLLQKAVKNYKHKLSDEID